MKKFMDKLRRFMGKSTTDANAPINEYGYLDDEDDVEYYEEEEEE